jgi:hypothetical protein
MALFEAAENLKTDNQMHDSNIQLDDSNLLDDLNGKDDDLNDNLFSDR